jgi:hypothetical protein
MPEEGRGREAGRAAAAATTTKQDETDLAVCFVDNNSIYFDFVWYFGL